MNQFSVSQVVNSISVHYTPNTSLIALPRLLNDESFRSWAVKQCRDPFVRAFWANEFDQWDRRYRLEAIAPIQNKLGQFVSVPALRHVLGQIPLDVDFRDVLDSGRILIVNLSKGKLGEDASRLVGALLTQYAWQRFEHKLAPERREKEYGRVMELIHRGPYA